MSGKNQCPSAINWQSTDPRIGFLPLNNITSGKGTLPSGVLDGVMSGTDTIWSQIVDVSRMDDIGLEVAWTGTPTGTLSVLVSISGINWNALTFDPVIGQPTGSDAGEFLNLSLVGFKYILLQYVNSSGSGIMTTYMQVKDLN